MKQEMPCPIIFSHLKDDVDKWGEEDWGKCQKKKTERVGKKGTCGSDREYAQKVVNMR